MARRGKNPDLNASGLDDLATAQRLAAVAVGGIRRTDGRAGEFVEHLRGLGVVLVAMGDENELHRPRGGQGREVRFVERPGIHDDHSSSVRRGNDVRVGAVKAHRTRIRREPRAGEVAAVLESGVIDRIHFSILAHAKWRDLGREARFREPGSKRQARHTT